MSNRAIAVDRCFVKRSLNEMFWECGLRNLLQLDLAIIMIKKSTQDSIALDYITSFEVDVG
jgi:hypothetical protein